MSVRNGNQELVYNAVRGGYKTAEQIVAHTRLSRNTVYGCLRRLRDVRRVSRHKNGNPVHYEAHQPCLLQELWGR